MAAIRTKMAASEITWCCACSGGVDTAAYCLGIAAGLYAAGERAGW